MVVSELPVVQKTLLLRVLGARQTFTNAVAELRGLSPEEEEFVMSAQSEYQAWKRELLEKGMEEGLQSGAEKALRKTLSRLLSARFGVLSPRSPCASTVPQRPSSNAG